MRHSNANILHTTCPFQLMFIVNAFNVFALNWLTVVVYDVTVVSSLEAK